MNNNQQPNYVLKFNETDSRKVKDRNYYIMYTLRCKLMKEIFVSL